VNAARAFERTLPGTTVGLIYFTHDTQRVFVDFQFQYNLIAYNAKGHVA
jgi:hypothetical protein